MTVATYQVGQVVRLAVDVEVSDTNTDPTGLTFRLRVGTGDPTVYIYGTDAEVVKSGTGVYYVDWTIEQEGVHYYKWTGTGTAAGAIEHQFRVENSAFHP